MSQKTLFDILDVPEAVGLAASIAKKGESARLDGLSHPAEALRFIRSTLRGSYLFARLAVPSYAAAAFAVLREFPPVDDRMGAMFARILEAVKGELLNNNIYDRPGECHSHYHDAREAYAAAGGDMEEVAAFERLAAEEGFVPAIEKSSFWSPGSRSYARAMLACCDDPLALFILMPANEELTPKVYARALASLPRTPRFAKFRQFFSRHVELDEGDHGPAALDWLDLYVRHAKPSRDERRIAARKALDYL